jgi:hypothetical protein
MALSHTVETILCIMLAVHRLYTPLYTFNVTEVNVERVDDSNGSTRLGIVAIVVIPPPYHPLSETEPW